MEERERLFFENLTEAIAKAVDRDDRRTIDEFFVLNCQEVMRYLGLPLLDSSIREEVGADGFVETLYSKAEPSWLRLTQKINLEGDRTLYQTNKLTIEDLSEKGHTEIKSTAVSVLTDRKPE